MWATNARYIDLGGPIKFIHSSSADTTIGKMMDFKSVLLLMIGLTGKFIQPSWLIFADLPSQIHLLYNWSEDYWVNNIFLVLVDCCHVQKLTGLPVYLWENVRVYIMSK